jgi:hypothetical protein
VAAPGLVAPTPVALGDGVAGLVAVGDGVPRLVAVGDGVAGALPEEVARGVPLAEMPGVARLVPPGENEGGDADGVPPVQADNDAGTTTARAAQRRAMPARPRQP